VSAQLNKAATIYILAFTVFVLGIWLIIELGSIYLTAPRDISGTWSLRENPSAAPTQSFSVDQSGKYVRFSLHNGPTFDAILGQVLDNQAQPGQQSLTFAGEGWQVVATGRPLADSLQFQFTPPSSVPGPRAGIYQRERMGSLPSPTPKPLAASNPNAFH
jgi:hypothetical protein